MDNCRPSGKMRILLLTQLFSPTLGGGEIVFYNLAKKLALRGHDIFVICHRLQNAEETISHNIHVHRIKPKVNYRNSLPISMKDNIGYILNAILQGSRLIKQQKIDLIHANSYGSIIAASVLSKLHGKPLVATIHDIFSSGSSDNWKSWAKQNNLSKISVLLGPVFEKLTVSMPIDVIHSISETTKEDIKRFCGKSNIVVIPNGIDLNDYPSDNTDRFPVQSYVLYIGRLVFYKNLNVVIAGFRKVAKELPSAKLIVAGDGPMKKPWQKMVSDLNLEKNVEFIGMISHNRKLELLRNCAFLVLPSVFEGFGLVLLEAFAMNKPVLVANVPPFNEVVQDGIDGYFIPPDDPEKWSEKVIKLLSDKDLCVVMGRHGRDKVEKTFNLEKVSQEMERLYVKLIS